MSNPFNQSPGPLGSQLPNLVIRDINGKEIKRLNDGEILNIIRDAKLKSSILPHQLFLNSFPGSGNRKRDAIVSKLGLKEGGVLIDDGKNRTSLVDILNQVPSRNKVIYRGREISITEYILMREDSLDLIKKIFWVYGMTHLNLDVFDTIYLLFILCSGVSISSIKIPYQIVEYLSRLSDSQMDIVAQDLALVAANYYGPRPGKIQYLAFVVSRILVWNSNVSNMRDFIRDNRLNLLDAYRFITYVNHDLLELAITRDLDSRNTSLNIIGYLTAYSSAEKHEYGGGFARMGNNVGGFVAKDLINIVIGYISDPLMDIFNSLGIGSWHYTTFVESSDYFFKNFLSYIIVPNRGSDLPHLMDVDFKTGMTRSTKNKEITFKTYPNVGGGFHWNILRHVHRSGDEQGTRNFLLNYTDDELVSFLKELNPEVYEFMIDFDLWDRKPLIDALTMIIGLLNNEIPISNKGIKAALIRMDDDLKYIRNYV